MGNDKDSLVLDLGKVFFEFVSSEASVWDRAYLRCEYSDGMTSIASIVVDKAGVPSFLRIKDFGLRDAITNHFDDIGESIKQETGKDIKVCLVRVSSNFDFKMFFDYDDTNKWPIPNLNDLKLDLLPID